MKGPWDNPERPGFPGEGFCRLSALTAAGATGSVIYREPGAGLHGVPDREARGQVSGWQDDRRWRRGDPNRFDGPFAVCRERFRARPAARWTR